MRVLTQLEADSFRLKQLILQTAGREGIDSGALVLALADVLAVTAATLDRFTGERTLDDRLGSFLARVEETYRNTRNLMATAAIPVSLTPAGERR